MIDTSIIAQAEAVSPLRAYDIPQSCPEIDTVISLVSDMYDELLSMDTRSASNIQNDINETMEKIRTINAELREALHDTDNALSLKDLAIYELKDRIEELEEE